MNDRHHPFVMSIDLRLYAQCRDCLTPMIGIFSHEARDFCIEHEDKSTPSCIDLSLCKGL